MIPQEKRKDQSEALLRVFEQSIFSHFPDSALQYYVWPHLQFHEALSSDEISRPRGADCVFMVLEGSVDLYSGSMCIGSVTRGRCIELRSVLKRQNRWTYHWQASQRVKLISLASEFFFPLLEAHPEIQSHLLKMTMHWTLQRFNHDLHLLGLSPEQCRLTIQHLEKIPLSELRLLKGASHFVLVDSGSVEVQNNSPYFLKPGDTSVVDPTAETSFEVDTAGEAWVLELQTWRQFVSSGQIEEILQLMNAQANPDAILPSPSGRETQVSEEDEDLETTDEDLSRFMKSNLEKKKTFTKFPFVAQHEEMDCGAACLSMILKHFGKNISISRLRDSLNVSAAGSTLSDMQRAASKFGLDTIALEVAISDLTQLQTPFVSLNQNHYIVVYEISDGSLTIADPGIGVFRQSLAEFNNSFSSVVLLTITNQNFPALAEDKVPWRKMLNLFRGYKTDFSQVLALQIVIFFLSLAFPIFLQLLFDDLLSLGNVGNLEAFFLGFVVISIVRLLSDWCFDHLTTHLSSRFITNLNSNFIHHVLSLPLSHFSVRRTGDFLSRMDELRKIERFLLGKPLRLIAQLLSTLLFGVALYLYHPWLLLFALVAVPILLAIAALWSRVVRDLNNQLFQARSRAESRFVETLGSLETLRSLNAGISARWRWQSDYSKLTQLDRSTSQVSIKMHLFSQTLEHILNGAIFLLAAHLHLQGSLSLGQAVASTLIASRFIEPLIALFSDWKTFSEIAVSFEKVDEIFTAPREPDNATAPEVDFKGAIEIRNLNFRYGGEGSPLALANINLVIRSGETVAFVGASGSGKTTLAKIINRLYFPVAGQILFDGQDSANLSLKNCRTQMAMILQENVVFSGTVLENIALGDSEPSMERAINAAKLAEAHDFISRLEMGYHQVLNCESDLSGGERQRIAIARAFYAEPKILIMDEATSALDSISERKILRSLNKQRNLRTVIHIAHRLNSIVDADRIVVFENGEIIEQGDHQTLMRLRGFYYRLFKHQLSA